MKERTLLRVTLFFCIITLISFWAVVIFGGIYIHRALTTINEAQTQIETAVDSLEEIDIKDLNQTIESLKQAGEAIQGLTSIITGTEEE